MTTTWTFETKEFEFDDILVICGTEPSIEYTRRYAFVSNSISHLRIIPRTPTSKWNVTFMVSNKNHLVDHFFVFDNLDSAIAFMAGMTLHIKIDTLA